MGATRAEAATPLVAARATNPAATAPKSWKKGKSSLGDEPSAEAQLLAGIVLLLPLREGVVSLGYAVDERFADFWRALAGMQRLLYRQKKVLLGCKVLRHAMSF